MSNYLEAAERLLTYRGHYNWPTQNGPVSREQDIRTVAEAVKRLKPDEADFDCTDAAHPAWWRGHDHGAESICREAKRILDGGEIHGSCAEPWQGIRQRLADLVKNTAAAFTDIVSVVSKENEDAKLP